MSLNKFDARCMQEKIEYLIENLRDGFNNFSYVNPNLGESIEWKVLLSRLPIMVKVKENVSILQPLPTNFEKKYLKSF